MTALEKLARRICWLGFISPRRLVGCTEAAYWRSLPMESKDSYIEDARDFVRLLRLRETSASLHDLIGNAIDAQPYPPIPKKGRRGKQEDRT